jgi:ankyrin repeat protein
MFLLTPKALLQNIHKDFINACAHSSIENVKNTIQYIPNINTIINDANPLISCASFGRLELVKLLLENGADPNIFNNKGYTALHCVVYLHSNGHNESAYLEIARLLIEKGAIINLANFDGDKPIDIAKDVNMINLLSNS